MKKLFYLFFAFVVVALLSSCEKDPPVNPDPDPDPHTNPVIEIQVDFSAKPDNMLLDFTQPMVLLDKDKNLIKIIPYTFPISTLRLTGDEALSLAGKKAYVFFNGSRIYPPNGGDWNIQKAIDPVLVYPKINKVVIPIPADITVPCIVMDP